MPIFFFTLLVGVLAFAYVLTPLTRTAKKTQRSRSPSRRKRSPNTDSLQLEEAALELATGKLSQADYANFAKKVEAGTEAEADEAELEREIQRLRKKRRKS